MEDFDPIAYINEPRWRHIRPGLDRIRELLFRLDNPQNSLSFVHVAGTNGKGSTCAYIAQILKTAGYKVGLFSSPYIIDFCERIQINNDKISRYRLKSVTSLVKQCADSMVADGWEHPTEFELMTAVAFEYFFQEKCSIVVCEVGLGGRLDSTNVIEKPEVSVVTAIGYDHVAILGDSLIDIANEKAGIIKKQCPCVTYCFSDKRVEEVIFSVAKHQHAPFYKINECDVTDRGIDKHSMRHFEYQGLKFQTRMIGSYQIFNAALAIRTAMILQSKGWNISNDSIYKGIEATVWPYRFQVESFFFRTVVLDGAHNAQGARALIDSLDDCFPKKRVVFVFSVLKDKDYSEMIRLLCRRSCEFICVTADSDRALEADKLALVLKEQIDQRFITDMSKRNTERPKQPCNEKVFVAKDFSDAIKKARQMTSPSDVICVCGSLYSLRLATAALQKEM